MLSGPNGLVSKQTAWMHPRTNTRLCIDSMNPSWIHWFHVYGDLYFHPDLQGQHVKMVYWLPEHPGYLSITENCMQFRLAIKYLWQFAFYPDFQGQHVKMTYWQPEYPVSYRDHLQFGQCNKYWYAFLRKVNNAGANQT